MSGNVKQAVPAATEILLGHGSSNGTFLTVPAGRTWQGWVSLNAALVVAASGAAVTSSATISVAGATATPAAGVILRVWCAAPAQTASSTAQVVNRDQTFMTIVAGTSAATLTLAVNSLTSGAATASGALVN